MGGVFLLKAGVPPLTLIADILFNILLDDIDKEIEERLLPYARFQHEIFVPIYHKDKEQTASKAFHEIFKQCNLRQPTLVRAVRAGEPIPFSGGIIQINNEGKSQIQQ